MLIAWPMFLPQWNDYIDKSHIGRKIWWPQDTLVTNGSIAIMKFSCISETASGFNLSWDNIIHFYQGTFCTFFASAEDDSYFAGDKINMMKIFKQF